MSFLFGINNEILNSELQVARFRIKDKDLKKFLNLKLFKCYPQNNSWKIEMLENQKKNDFFYILNNEEISNNNIFFLSNEDTLANFNTFILENYNIDGALQRANFKIYLKNGGFSSYQSDYPFELTTKKGSVVTSVNSLFNSNADINYIFFRNIFYKPIEDKFNSYLVDYKNKKILMKYELKTNNSNFIEIEKKFIKDGIFFVTQEYIGIPMYVSIKNNFLSFEHTHPLNAFLLNEDKYVVASNLKKEMNEIIYKEDSK